MFRVTALSVCLALFLSASVGIAKPNAAGVVEAVSPVEVSSIEERVFQTINQVREENNLEPLSYRKDLSVIARSHSSDMASRDYFSHISPDGENLQKRISRGGITDWTRLAENIASNQGFSDPASIAVKGWLESPGHRHNILDKNLTETGIGVAIDARGKVYLTQLFAKRKI